jgi:hypothetical protein
MPQDTTAVSVQQAAGTPAMTPDTARVTNNAEASAASWERCWDDHLRASRERKDLLAMQMLAPLSSTYLPWTVSAMRPSGVVVVLNEIAVNGRQSIVELGSGVSTFYIGRLLQRLGGRLWTMEHDERWADQVDQELRRQALDDVVTVIRAPLTPSSPGWPGEDGKWYERGKLTETIAGGPVDLLLVDGPPAYLAGREHSRYPAVPFFAPMLADDYAIILDDASRQGEQDIMERWERQLSITFERRLINGGIGIGRSRPAFTV